MDAHIHPETLEEKPPEFLSSWIYLGKTFIQHNGWLLLGAGVILCCLWIRMKSYIEKFREQQEERRYAALWHKNPDLVHARQEAMEAARLRFQTEHDKKANQHAEKMKERDAKKREEYLGKQGERVPVRVGYRLSDQTSSSNNEGQTQTKSSYRPDYNPLMGAGGSGGYRPPRRTCPGGGCG
ncbi:selenoprotein S-like isoform X1 [Zootermopsis nevadensis]|uniref:Selenoprotein S n=1 Tax=Zootermopsis nevadensis TaxID=136037 RepID=A0A067RMQ0_ZOONE|nr:selenoprotein S-like isoform X1 [Zootermopsis nevadensis]KDR21890.1 Selenoprotein S [Zootermopsis nevadensis]